jgi:hypothetical protein
VIVLGSGLHCTVSVLHSNHISTMNASVFTQHIQARDHIALERLDNCKQYKTLLTNADKHAFYRAHIAATDRMFKWNLLSDPKAAALRTASFGNDAAKNNGYISDDDQL